MAHNSGECHGDFFALSKRAAFKILALVVSDSLKALIKIAYPEWDIMRVGKGVFREPQRLFLIAVNRNLRSGSIFVSLGEAFRRDGRNEK